MIKAQATHWIQKEDQEFKEKLDILKEDRKDDRVKKASCRAVKLISQRKGERGELEEVQGAPSFDVNEMI